jgi:pSer/pThr/pTyr-binding forkhead associated (FHA) protein
MSLFKRKKNKEFSITFMSGPHDGQREVFEQPDMGDERVIHIGRRDGCEINLGYDNQVSRLHARLICGAVPVTGTDSVPSPFVLAFWLEDERSRNGTYLEKETDGIKGRVSLRPGVMFRIGRTWLRLDVPYGD